MKKLVILSIAFMTNACYNSDNPINTTVPNCIQSIIDNSNSSKDLRSVRVQEVNRELHYWLNTDFRHSDGVEYIINSKCDTICGFCGECLPAKCSEDYNENWIVIWEK